MVIKKPKVFEKKISLLLLHTKAPFTSVFTSGEAKKIHEIEFFWSGFFVSFVYKKISK